MLLGQSQATMVQLKILDGAIILFQTRLSKFVSHYKYIESFKRKFWKEVITLIVFQIIQSTW